MVKNILLCDSGHLSTKFGPVGVGRSSGAECLPSIVKRWVQSPALQKTK